MELAGWEQVSLNPSLLDLCKGQPHPSLFDRAGISQAAVDMFSRQDIRNCMAYSAELGTATFRRTLASFLTDEYGCPV